MQAGERLTLLCDGDRFGPISLNEPTMPTPKNRYLAMPKSLLDPLLRLLLIGVFALSPHALAAADKSELYRLAAEMVRVQNQLDVLASRQVDKTLLAQYKQYIDTLPADQIADLVEQYAESIASDQAKIKALNAPAPVRSKALLRELDALRTQYQRLLSAYSAEFSRNNRLKPIFKANPFETYNAQYGLDSDDLPPAGEELAVYRGTIDELKLMHSKVNDISANDIRNVLKSVGSSKKLYELNAARDELNEAAEPLIAELKRHKNRAENHLDEARLNCRAESPNFDCFSRCEQRVRDPIFGTYRMEPNARCLSDCQAPEERAMDSLRDQIIDCKESRDDAREIVDRAKEEFNATRSKLMSIDGQLNRLDEDFKKIEASRQAVSALHRRLGGAASASLVDSY